MSDAQNGANLAAVMQSLQPGERLEIGTGTYSIASFFDLSLRGTAAAPIWIVAQDGATPVITRPDANQNTVNLGSNGPCEFVALRGLEITGGSIALRLHDCNDVWIDQCHVHDCADNAIAVSTSKNTENSYALCES